MATKLKEEESALNLYKFTGEQASKDYPYLFSLVAVRLWAMAEAAAREVLVEASKTPLELPVTSALAKLKAPIAPYVGASLEMQANLVADALWHSAEGDLKGVDRFDTPLNRIGLVGSLPGVVREILRELSEVRHCVVHRGGLADRRTWSTG